MIYYLSCPAREHLPRGILYTPKTIFMRKMFVRGTACLLLPCLLLLLCMLPRPVWSQGQPATRTITGKVTTSGTREPVSGVSVRVKRGRNGTSTLDDGSFSLRVNSADKVLVLSHVGYETREVAIDGSDLMNLDLKRSSDSLSDVVVVGYGSLRRGQVTSAVADVKPGDFNQGGARNVLDLIQGKVAGVNLTRTAGANPNSGVSFQIRSATSVTGGNSPLIVIDGIPNGNLDLLQQDDIASFSILKDGSAAAIYGTQANGGVILITTKKGRSGPTRFDYNGYVSKLYIRQRPHFLTGEEYRKYATSGLFNTAGMQSYTTGIYSTNTDMYDLVTNHDNLTNYNNLAISGGGNNTSYRASLYYSHLDGIAKANDRKQYGARFSLQGKGLDNRLNVQLDLITNFNKANLFGGGQWGSALTRLPTMPLYDSTGQFYSVNGISNPASDLAHRQNYRDQSTNSADGKVTLELWKGIRAGMFGSILRDSWEDNDYRDLLSDDSRYNGDAPKGGYAGKASTVNTRYDFTPTIEYSRGFGDHHVAAVAGYDYQYDIFSNWSASNRGFQNDLLTSFNLGAGTLLGLGKGSEGSAKSTDKLIAFFGRINYDFRERYMLQLVFRREGSSKFGANHKWGNFPAASIGWDIAKEDFMKGVTWANQLKFRAGYGVTGNSGIDPYQSLVRLSTGGQYAYPDGVYRQTWGPSNNPNPDLKWEKKAETNIGLDFGLLNNRLTGSFDAFYRKTTDLLSTYNAQLPPYVQGGIYTNVGSFSSEGLELALSYMAVKTRNFSWKTDVTASTTSNKVISLSNGLYHVSFVDFGGIPGAGALGNALRLDSTGRVGNFYGRRFAGFDANGNWQFYKKDGKTVVGLSQITDADKVILGNALPKLYLSWTNSFTYKDFDLRVFFRGRFGYKILNSMALSYGNNAALPNNVLKETFTKFAKIRQTYQYSDYYLEPGGFLKLDNVTLGYTFRLHSALVRSLRLYVSGSNLAIFTKYKDGNDPDFVSDQFANTGSSPGIDAVGQYPSSRNYLVGVNFGF